MPICNRCGREESNDVPFPNWTKTICKPCDSERKAAWYQKKHGPAREKKPKEKIDRDAQICQDCREVFSYPRVKTFCDSCVERHEKQAREGRKQQKAEYDYLHLQGKRDNGWKRDEEGKEYHREYMREYRRRRKNGESHE